MVAAEGAWTLAFNRFGLGARPGTVRSGDPRQALLAELSAEEGARIERSDLLSTPKILQAVYDDDWRRKQERDRQDAARLAALAMPAPSVAALLPPSPLDARAAGGFDDERAAARAAVLSRRSASAARAGLFGADRLRRTPDRVLVESLLRLGRQERNLPRRRRRVRARGDPTARARPLRRHAARGRAAPGDAELPRQRAVDRPQLDRRPQQPGGAQREPRARDPRAAHDGRRLGLCAGRRDPARLHPHRLDDRRARRQARRAGRASPSTPTPTSRWRRRCAAASMSRTASRRARRRSPISPASRRPPSTSRRNSSATSSPTRPIRPWSRASPRRFATATATSPRSPARSSPTTRPGARRRPKCAIPGS